LKNLIYCKYLTWKQISDPYYS